MSAHELITNHLNLWTQAVTKKSTAGRGSNGKIELTGIKKLRELILELAVRGKLVEKDPDDEPAAALLQSIESHKTALIKSGTIKRKKPLPPVSQEEQPFELPQGWGCHRLGELVSKLGSGSTPRGGQRAYVDDGIPFLRSQNVWNDGLRLDDIVYISKDTHTRMGNTAVYPKDILLNITGASLGRSTIFPDQIPEANVSQHVTIVRLIEPAMTPFVHLCIQSPLIQSLVWGRQVGMAIEGLSKKVLERFEMPIPPLEEQHRIVQKVDELMALCDRLEQHTSDQLDAHGTLGDTLLGCLLKPTEGSFTQSTNATELAHNWARLAEHFDTLFTTEQSIEKLKQTILQLAVTGCLVGQDERDEPASDLIQRINEERAQLEGIGKMRVAKKASRESTVDPLPHAWATCTLGTCISLISGQHLKDDEYFDDKRPDSIPYLTGPAEFGARTPEPQRHTFVRRAVAEKGDILITCKGSGVGKLNIASEEIAISRQLMAARPILINAHFLYLLLDSLREAIREKTVGIAIPGISRGDILDVNIHLPPLEEQHRIVQKVDELMALCDHLKERLNQSSYTRCQLAGAVVEEALS